MENLLYALPALILALVGVIGLRKENEGKDKTITDYIKKNKGLKEENQKERHERHRIRYEFQIKSEEFEDELKKVKKSNASNQGWNTKYRKTIEKLDGITKYQCKSILKWEEKNKDQADTIKRMNSEFDEVFVLLETLLVTPKKKQAELVNQFTFKK